jgi:branched-chain amino acid aminotransferase
VGTAAVVVPIKSITRRSTSDRFTYLENCVEDGSCFARLFNALTGIQRGTSPDPFGWCTIIEAPESYMAVPT